MVEINNKEEDTMFEVYKLDTDMGWYYGCTKSWDKRLKQHKSNMNWYIYDSEVIGEFETPLEAGAYELEMIHLAIERGDQLANKVEHNMGFIIPIEMTIAEACQYVLGRIESVMGKKVVLAAALNVSVQQVNHYIKGESACSTRVADIFKRAWHITIVDVNNRGRKLVYNGPERTYESFKDLIEVLIEEGWTKYSIASALRCTTGVVLNHAKNKIKVGHRLHRAIQSVFGVKVLYAVSR